MQRCCNSGHEAEQKDRQSDKKFFFYINSENYTYILGSCLNFFLFVFLPSFHFAFFLLV